MKKLAVLAIAGLMSVTAIAADWILVTTDDETVYYIDTDSISSSGKYKTAFHRSDYYPPQSPTPFITIDQVIGLYRYDCKSNPKKFQVLSAVAYNNYAVVDSADYNENAKWYVVYPGTVGDTKAHFVCSR